MPPVTGTLPTIAPSKPEEDRGPRTAWPAHEEPSSRPRWSCRRTCRSSRRRRSRAATRTPPSTAPTSTSGCAATACAASSSAASRLTTACAGPSRTHWRRATRRSCFSTRSVPSTCSPATARARCAPSGVTAPPPPARRRADVVSPASDEDQHDLERDQQDDDHLERLAARRRHTLVQQVVDLLQHVELAPDALLPRVQRQALGGAVVDLREIQVAAQLERVVDPLDDARDVHPDRRQLRHRPAVRPVKQRQAGRASSRGEREGLGHVAVEDVVVVSYVERLHGQVLEDGRRIGG